MNIKDIEKGTFYRHHIYKDTLYFGHESYDRGNITLCKMRISIIWCSKLKYIGKGVPHQSDVIEAYYANFYSVSNKQALKFMENVNPD